MCGRVNVSNFSAILDIMEAFNIPIFPSHTFAGPELRYNITPGSDLCVFLQHQFTSMEWGIQFGSFKHPNTRTDTLKSKAYLQKLLLHQRCILPINSYYEWPDKKHNEKYKNIKTRFCIHTPEDVMFLAGIYKLSENHGHQFNVLTTKSNEEINEFHHRMPVILQPENVEHWIASQKIEELYQLMTPYEESLIIYECDEYVDHGRNEGKKCLAAKKHKEGKQLTLI